MRTTFPLTLILALLATSLALAAAPELVVNDRAIHTEPGIVVENGISYGPLRAVVEAVGGTVEWHEAGQFAVVCRGQRCVKIAASEGIMRENHLLLPIRKLAEKLGGSVTWVDSPPQVRISI